MSIFTECRSDDCSVSEANRVSFTICFIVVTGISTLRASSGTSGIAVYKFSSTAVSTVFAFPPLYFNTSTESLDSAVTSPVHFLILIILMPLNVETNTPSSFTTAEISIFTPIPLLEDKISLSPAASNLTVGVMIVFFLTPFPIVLIAFLSSSKFVLNFIIIFPFFITVMPLFLFCIFNMPNKIFHKKITADFFLLRRYH